PQKRDSWKAPRLLFTSNFDGPLDAYLEALRTGLGADGDAIFGHCADYPGSSSAQAWTAWLRARAVPSSLFFAAYGEQTVPEVHTAALWSVKPEAGVNVAFSYAGLRALGLPDATLGGFPEDFREGMAARAALLGDTAESAPERWEAGFVDPGVHMLLMISAQT